MRGLIFLPLFFLVSVFVHAQSYSSLKMEEIGSDITSCLPQKDSIFDCPDVIKGKSLIVTYNQKNEINHLGISLFSEETKKLINPSVCNFIERIMLELVLEKTSDELVKKLNRFKLNLSKNGITYGKAPFTSLSDVLGEIRNPVQFSLHKEPDKFAAVWEFNQDDQFILIFPATRDLIFGTDKKESDEQLSASLLEDSSPCKENDLTVDAISEKDLEFDPSKNIYIRKGQEFTFKFINSNTYYRKVGNTYELLFSEEFPAESLSNLMIKNKDNLSHTLHVIHRMYGHFSPDFDISLKKFICFFQDEYDIFTAVSLLNPKELKLTVILSNKNYNFVHMLLINTPIQAIFTKGGVLNANFYSNIPQQSIKNLIGDIQQK